MLCLPVWALRLCKDSSLGGGGCCEPLQAADTFLLASSYVVNVGLIDKLCGCFLSVQGPVDENPRLAALLQHAAGLLQGACTLCWAVPGR